MAQSTFSSWTSSVGCDLARLSENQALTQALQVSLSPSGESTSLFSSSDPIFLQYMLLADRAPAPPPPASPAAIGSCGARSRPAFCDGRIAKRKPRASKRRSTTYISADPANFRRMVQQVTGGVTLDDIGGRVLLPVDPVSRTQPLWAVAAPRPKLATTLPTLDTSSALVLEKAGSTRVGTFGPAEDGPQFQFEPSPVFPTLESWGVI